jgi:hypothetical protein
MLRIFLTFLVLSYIPVLSQQDSLFIFDSSDTAINKPLEITAEEIINRYLQAIGGAEKIYNIMDRTTIMRGSVQGINIAIVSYQKAPNKLKQEIKAGNSDQTIIFNGKKGIMKLAGEEKEISGSELEKLKYEATITLLTDLEHHGVKVTLEGKEKIEGKDAYKLIMTLPSGIKWTQFYDLETGLKIKEEKYISTAMGLFEQQIFYDDYKEVEGILYPFTIIQSIGAQKMEFTVSSIKVNTGLTDREFELE